MEFLYSLGIILYVYNCENLIIDTRSEQSINKVIYLKSFQVDDITSLDFSIKDKITESHVDSTKKIEYIYIYIIIISQMKKNLNVFYTN